ncbi:hypothetical protein Leryth_002282 [Lithospermum erythrorhizon]|nr:hypothetical protein Leryth_002282 [Lithospermum erythrorhizon]
MLRGNSKNTTAPVFLEENNLRYPTNASTQLQLLGNLPVKFNLDPVNYLGIEHGTARPPSNNQGRETEAISRQQKLPISLNQNVCFDEAERPATFLRQNPVSTGLRLSYDDDEHNSSLTSASGSMFKPPSAALSLNDNIRKEMVQQKEEFEKYIKTQEEILAKGVAAIRQRQMASFVNAVERSMDKKLREKDFELENINRKNQELIERVKQIATEAHNWCNRAKYNESVVNKLKNNLQQQMLGADHVKEGFGDNEIDDADSATDPQNHLSTPGRSFKTTPVGTGILCRACRVKEVSFLLMPCRHLCLCKDCDAFVNVCPVCQLFKSSSIQVYLC